MTARDFLKDIAADVLEELGYTEITVFLVKYNVLTEAYKRIDELGEYKALKAQERIVARVDSYRLGRPKVEKRTP